MSDIEDINNNFIDDEILIAIVQANPCLYAKNDASYKDNERNKVRIDCRVFDLHR